MNEEKFLKSVVKYLNLKRYKNNETDNVEVGRIVMTDNAVWDVNITAKRKGNLQKEFELSGSIDKEVNKND